jgi:hypothetical protein
VAVSLFSPLSPGGKNRVSSVPDFAIVFLDKDYFLPKIGGYMQQIRITRTSDLDSVLAFLKRRYPLLSEAEIIKCVSNFSATPR